MLWRGLGVIAIVALVLGALMSPVRAQDDAQATIEALQTQVAELTTPTAVPRQPTHTPPAIRPTPTPDAISQYPSAVAEVASQDSATGCDEIGWALSRDDLKSGDLDGEQILHHVACVGGGAYSIQGCVDVTDRANGALLSPPSGSLWLMCLVRVTNVGSDAIDVNPLYFSLVTATNERNSTSFEPMVAFPTIEMLQAGSLPPDQYVDGVVYFAVNRADELPFRIEIEPLTFGLSEQERGIVIVEELLDPDDW